MTKFSLGVDEFSEEDYTLIGVHSTSEDYHIAFLLNKFLKTKFKKAKKGLEMFQNTVLGEHSVYEYQDEKQDTDWYLIANICNIKQQSFGLFEEYEVRTYLIPERKTIDYFIKIYGYFQDNFIQELNKIPQIITSYEIDVNSLKSKDNLIL